MLFQNNIKSFTEENVANKIIISCPLKKTKIEGYLKEPLKISLAPRWEQLIDMDSAAKYVGGFFGNAGTAIAEGLLMLLKGSGKTIGRTGMFTTQYWLGASYIGLVGSIRIVNVDDKSRGQNSSFDEHVSSLLVWSSPISTTDPDLTFKNATDGNYSLTLFPDQPTTVNITSAYFEFTDMIIQNAAVVYSREMVKVGTKYNHLYADVAFELQSQQVLTSADLKKVLTTNMKK